MMLWKPAVIMGQVMWIRSWPWWGANAMEAGCDNGMGHVGEGADTMEACCDNYGTGHVEPGHGEGADDMEAGCDNGMVHVSEGEDTMKACCEVMWKLAMVKGKMLWKLAVIMGQVMWKIAMDIGEGPGGTVNGRTQKERRKAAKILKELSEVQKLANKRLGIRTRSINTCNHKMNISMVYTFSTEFECV